MVTVYNVRYLESDPKCTQGVTKDESMINKIKEWSERGDLFRWHYETGNDSIKSFQEMAEKDGGSDDDITSNGCKFGTIDENGVTDEW